MGDSGGSGGTGRAAYDRDTPTNSDPNPERSLRAPKSERDTTWQIGVGFLGILALLAGLFLVFFAPGPGASTSTTFVAPSTTTVSTPGSTPTTVTGTATTVSSTPGSPQRGSDVIDTALLGAGVVLVLCAIFYRRITKITLGGAEIDLSAAESALGDSTVKDTLAAAKTTASDDPDSRGLRLDTDLQTLAQTKPQRAATLAWERLDDRLQRVERQTLEARPTISDKRWLGGRWTIQGLVDVGALNGRTADFCIAVISAASELREGATATTDEWRHLYDLIDVAWTVLSPPMVFRARVEHELQTFGYKVRRATDQPSNQVTDLLVTRAASVGTLRLVTRAATNTDHAWLDESVKRMSASDHEGPRLIVVPTISNSLAGMVSDAQQAAPKASKSGLVFRTANDSEPTGARPTRLILRTDLNEQRREVRISKLRRLRATIQARIYQDGAVPTIGDLVAALGGPTLDVSNADATQA